MPEKRLVTPKILAPELKQFIAHYSVEVPQFHKKKINQRQPDRLRRVFSSYIVKERRPPIFPNDIALLCSAEYKIQLTSWA